MLTEKHKENLSDFISKCESEIEEYKLSDSDYCIILHSGSNLTGNKKVKCIYRNLDRLKERIEEDISHIDLMYKLDLQLWIFD